jgi:hypothetical protein
MDGKTVVAAEVARTTCQIVHPPTLADQSYVLKTVGGTDVVFGDSQSDSSVIFVSPANESTLPQSEARLTYPFNGRRRIPSPRTHKSV